MELEVKLPEGYLLDITKSGKNKAVLMKKNEEIRTVRDLLHTEPIEGYYIDMSSKLVKREPTLISSDEVNTFYSEKYAKSALAMAKISQLLPYYGGEITSEEWVDAELPKFIITNTRNTVVVSTAFVFVSFLAFRSLDYAKRFLANNKRLVEDYLLIE